jgi:hypothetical protein
MNTYSRYPMTVASQGTIRFGSLADAMAPLPNPQNDSESERVRWGYATLRFKATLRSIFASGFRLQASGFRLQASGFRLQASAFRDGFILHTCERLNCAQQHQGGHVSTSVAAAEH